MAKFEGFTGGTAELHSRVDLQELTLCVVLGNMPIDGCIANRKV